MRCQAQSNQVVQIIVSEHAAKLDVVNFEPRRLSAILIFPAVIPLALSIISSAELWEGAYFSRDPKRSQAMLEEFLAVMVILGLDEDISKRFGQLRGSLRKRAICWLRLRH